MKRLILLILVLSVLSFLPKAEAQIPRTLTVQGLLADSLSRPVVDGIHAIVICL